MKCRNCGAAILETDQFCAQCGHKVIRERRCPDCGTLLRDGMKFCHECGRLVGAGNKMSVTDESVITQETLDIPIADIEKNILLETEHEIGEVAKKTRKKTLTKEAQTKEDKVTTLPKKKVKREPERPIKKKIHEEWEDNEEEYEEEGEEYEEKDHNIITIVSAVMALLIFAIAAFLIFHMVRNQPNKDYGESIENVQDAENGEGDNTNIISEEQTVNVNGENLEIVGILKIDSNVNVRDNPSTEGTNIIKVAKAGDMYQHLGQTEDENWYIILLEDGSIGYVFKDYVTVK